MDEDSSASVAAESSSSPASSTKPVEPLEENKGEKHVDSKEGDVTTLNSKEIENDQVTVDKNVHSVVNKKDVQCEDEQALNNVVEQSETSKPIANHSQTDSTPPEPVSKVKDSEGEKSESDEKDKYAESKIAEGNGVDQEYDVEVLTADDANNSQSSTDTNCESKQVAKVSDSTQSSQSTNDTETTINTDAAVKDNGKETCVVKDNATENDADDTAKRKQEETGDGKLAQVKPEDIADTSEVKDKEDAKVKDKEDAKLKNSDTEHTVSVESSESTSAKVVQTKTRDKKEEIKQDAKSVKEICDISSDADDEKPKDGAVTRSKVEKKGVDAKEKTDLLGKVTLFFFQFLN